MNRIRNGTTRVFYVVIHPAHDWLTYPFDLLRDAKEEVRTYFAGHKVQICRVVAKVNEVV